MRGILGLFVAVFFMPGFFVGARGDVLDVPVVMHLTPQSASAIFTATGFFAPSAGQWKADIPDVSASLPYPVLLSGIHLTLDYGFDPPVATGEDGVWSVGSSTVAADLKIDAMDV